MEKITIRVDRVNALNALGVAYQYIEHYRSVRKPNVPMILGEMFMVSHTQTGTIIVKQIKVTNLKTTI